MLPDNKKKSENKKSRTENNKKSFIILEFFAPMFTSSPIKFINPRARGLYKELIFTASLYNALPLDTCRNKIKKQFIKNKDLTEDSAEFKKALAWGRHEIKEMKAMHEIRVYRRMKSQYEDPEHSSMAPTPFSELTMPKPHVPVESRRGAFSSSSSSSSSSD